MLSPWTLSISCSGTNVTTTHYNGFLKLVEAEALLQIHPCFFLHSIKQRVLPLSAVTASLHLMPKMSKVNSHMRRGVMRGGKRGTIPRAPNRYGGVESLRREAEWLPWALKNPNNITNKYSLQCSTFASAKAQVRTWGGKLASCPGRHLTSLRAWCTCGKTH